MTMQSETLCQQLQDQRRNGVSGGRAVLGLFLPKSLWVATATSPANDQVITVFGHMRDGTYQCFLSGMSSKRRPSWEGLESTATVWWPFHLKNIFSYQLMTILSEGIGSKDHSTVWVVCETLSPVLLRLPVPHKDDHKKKITSRKKYSYIIQLL